MKKLLMIGAILLMGTLGYGAQEAELDSAGNATTALTLRTKGNVKDVTNKAQLVITPINGTGAYGDKLMFSFGSVAPGDTSTLRGKFKAEVLKYEGSTIKYGILKDGTNGNVKVGLVDKNGTGAPDINGSSNIITSTIKDNVNNTELGSIEYILSSASGVRNNGRAYEGEIISTLKAHNTNTGEFTDTGVLVVVNVNAVELEK